MMGSKTGVVCGMVLFALILAGTCSAADYPRKPIEILCPYAAGSSMDIMGRLWGDIGSKYLGQPVVMVAKPGAGGAVAAAEVVSSKPDGYKLITLANMFHATTTKTQKLPFDPDDIAPLVNLMEYRFGLAVRADSPFKTLNDLIAYGKKNPGKLRWAHSGRGISLHIIVLQMFQKAGVQAIDVPYKGGTAETMAALLGGHVDASSTVYGPLRDQVKDGKIRFLTFFSGHRFADQPNVPSVAELGFPEATKLATYCGLYLHKDTPESIKTYLLNVSKKIYDDPRYTKGIEDLGEAPVFGGPEWMKESIKKAEEAGVPALKELGLYVGK